MYHFDALEDDVSTLDRLAQRDSPLVCILARQPGTKEYRYMHLFSGEPLEPTVTRATLEREVPASPTQDAPVPVIAPPAQRLARLEEEVASLRQELSDMQQQLAAFRKQFE